MQSKGSTGDASPSRYFNLVRYYAGVGPGGRRFVASVGMTNLEGETLDDPAEFVRRSLHLEHKPRLITEGTAGAIRWNRKATMINYQLYVWWLTD